MRLCVAFLVRPICRPFRARRSGWSIPRVETWLKPWAEIGVGTKVGFAPPSEPDGHISWIRLSSRWLAFKKIGVPQRALVLRRTSRLRRSKCLAIGSDLFFWPGLGVHPAPEDTAQPPSHIAVN